MPLGDRMLKDLVKIADKLDQLGLQKEANFIDSLLRKIALEEMSKEERIGRSAEKIAKEKLEDFIHENPEATEEEIDAKLEEYIDLAKHMYNVSYPIAGGSYAFLLKDVYLDEATTKDKLDEMAKFWADQPTLYHGGDYDHYPKKLN
jgi:hypothetical protein